MARKRLRTAWAPLCWREQEPRFVWAGYVSCWHGMPESYRRALGYFFRPIIAIKLWGFKMGTAFATFEVVLARHTIPEGLGRLGCGGALTLSGRAESKG